MVKKSRFYKFFNCEDLHHLFKLIHTRSSGYVTRSMHNIPFFKTRHTFWTPAFRWKGVLWFHNCQYVSMSVSKGVFSKTTHRIFLKLLMKLGCLKGKKLTEPNFLKKISFLEIMLKNTIKIEILGFCKKIFHWCVDILGLNHAPWWPLWFC